MKKNTVIGVIIAGVVVAGLLLAMALNNKKQSMLSDPHSINTQTIYKTVDACDLFTETKAKAVLGAAASKGKNTPAASADNIKVTNCIYTNNATVVANIRTASVLVRSARNTTGQESNKTAFSNAKPANAEKVNGYGDEAYYANHQLNILDEHNWIIITNGSTNPAQHILADAQLVADTLAK